VEDSQTGPTAVPSRRPPAADPPVDDADLAPPGRERLVRLAYRFCWDHHDAEDLIHDALIAAEQKRAQLEDQRKWAPWLYRIVIQRCLLHRRKTAVRRRHLVGIAATRIRSGADRQPATRIETRELGEILKTLLAELTERQRTAIVLRHLENMDYRAIAAVMQIAESTARVHVRAARESLRRMILERYPEWAGAHDK